MSRTSLKFGSIRPLIVELAALEHLEKSPYDLTMGEMLSTL